MSINYLTLYMYIPVDISPSALPQICFEVSHSVLLMSLRWM